MNKLGFGFLRLPPKEGGAAGELDWASINKMVDAYLALGGDVFDTCYTYLDGASEEAVRRCVAERIPRENYVLVEKLPGYYCRNHEDCEKYFQEELQRCGVDHFDVFMIHWLNPANYVRAEQTDQFRFLREKKACGQAGRIGFSYHGSARLLDQILTNHPETEVVLLQINYLDWEASGIESRLCYETAVRHGKKVFVMEPVKGGTLASIPKEAETVLQSCHPDWTPADWALRFVQSLPDVEVCLSGMNTLKQVQANMRQFEPLAQEEVGVLFSARDLIRRQTNVPCTGCRYCEAHCPMSIPISEVFRLYNEIYRYPQEGWKIRPVYAELIRSCGKASDCIGCGACAAHCPQGIGIPAKIHEAAELLEN